MFGVLYCRYIRHMGPKILAIIDDFTEKPSGLPTTLRGVVVGLSLWPRCGTHEGKRYVFNTIIAIPNTETLTVLFFRGQ